MRALVLAFVMFLASCGSPTEIGAPDPTSTLPAATSSTTDTTKETCSTASEEACDLDDPLPRPTGRAKVTIGDETLEFETTRCLVAEGAFVIDGVADDGSTTLAIRHASPPTRAEPQPSMSYLLIDPEPAYQSPPAAVTFDTYDPEAGTATGSVDETTSFSVQCER